MDEEDKQPILAAVSSSARQLYLLLRCINFADKAHVEINHQGLKLSVDDSSVMGGSVFLSKDLFTTYTFHAPPQRQNDPSEDEEANEEDSDLSAPTFQISLPAFLETLQIFGFTDPLTSKSSWARDQGPSMLNAFSTNVLGMNSLCRLVYDSAGSPLIIILTEPSVRTTCTLTTYEPSFADEIPFDRHNIALKTIMRAQVLYDALTELASISPDKITLWAHMRSQTPLFTVAASGTLGSTSVSLSNEPSNEDASMDKGKGKKKTRPGAPSRTPLNNALPTAITSASTSTADPSSTATANDADSLPLVLETFHLSDPDDPLKASYKFSLFLRAQRAMSVASKVSVRVDEQGVLSLQFMIEVESGKVSFVDFRFVPLVEDDEEVAEGPTIVVGEREE